MPIPAADQTWLHMDRPNNLLYVHSLMWFPECPGLERLEAWDVLYASEQLKERLYAFSSQEVRAYFPEDRVLAGAAGILPHVTGLHLELSLVPLYADQKLFAEMTALARTLGFEPWAIWPTFFDPETGRLLQVWNNGTFSGNYTQFRHMIAAGLPPTQTPNLFVLGSAAAFLTQRPFSV